MHGCVHPPFERNTLLSPSPDPHEKIAALLASAAWIDLQGNREKRARESGAGRVTMHVVPSAQGLSAN
jgi:hypothetical protein